MSINEFREIIIPGEKESESDDFSFGNFVTVLVTIPNEFKAAAWGYGRHYADYYGRGL